MLFAIVTLDLWIMITTTEAAVKDGFSLFGHQEAEEVERLLPQLEVEKWKYEKRFRGTEHQDAEVREYIKGFSEEQAKMRIRDLRTLPYIWRMMEQAHRRYEIRNQQRHYVFKAKHFTIPRRFEGLEFTESDYIEHCIDEVGLTWGRLRSFYDLIVQLRENLVCAASSGLLDETSLEALKQKMQVIQDNIFMVCDPLRLPHVHLVFPTDPWWEEPPKSSEPEKQFTDGEPKNTVAAYEAASSVHASLVFFVPVISCLSCIPMAFAWLHSSHQVGTTRDAEFYQLLSSSAMQILTILTMIAPTIYNIRLARQAWFWTWVLAGSSTSCAVIAVPLYLKVNTEWSVVVSFMGTVAQTFVTLQLMFAL